MRSLPAGTFARIAAPAALWRAWLAHRRGKRRRGPVALFDLDADRHVFALHRALVAGTYRPGRYRQQVVRDPKVRLISAPSLRDRLLHQAIVDELAPAFVRSFIDHSYACLPGRGPQRAVVAYLAWTRCHRWRLRLDVARYFPSIDHEVLLELLGRRLRPGDGDTRALLRRLVTHGGDVYQTRLAREVLRVTGASEVPLGRGLPIGSSLSQWAANVYLDGVDHFVVRTLKVGAYLRYMDDLTLFGDDAGELAEAGAAIEDWMRRERRLEIHPPEAPHEAAEPSTFLGYRVSRGGLSPGKKMRARLARRVRAAALRGPEALERTLEAYAGIVRFG
ncbi:MAG TPA: reverse transcriptase domain-containing protein [Nannocystaceae bacterium]|nr:reverse transcriptase domain-containing protein [Nannocystaceae bacterium]